LKLTFFAPAARRLKGFQPTIYRKARPVLALALALLILLPSFAVTLSGHTLTSGQSDPALVDSFIIEAINGGTACREARPEEVPLTLPRPDDVGVPVTPLRLKDAPDQVQAQSDNASTGLTINFFALSQLQSDPNMATVVAAFQRAAAVWTDRIKSPVTVSINIDYGVNTPGGSPFPTGVLGSTSSRRSLVDYPSVRTNLLASSSSGTESSLYNLLPSSGVPTDVGNGGIVSLNRSLAFALGIPVSSPGDPNVATMGFNKNFPFDFNPDNGITPGTRDVDRW
jgi:hypothetical protein